MKSIYPALLLLFGTLFMTGCAAIMSRNDWNGGRMLESPKYFTGVTVDALAIRQCVAIPFDGDPQTDNVEFLGFALYAVDLPFSLIADLFYIPADYRYHKGKLRRPSTSVDPSQDVGASKP